MRQEWWPYLEALTALRAEARYRFYLWVKSAVIAAIPAYLIARFFGEGWIAMAVLTLVAKYFLFPEPVAKFAVGSEDVRISLLSLIVHSLAPTMKFSGACPNLKDLYKTSELVPGTHEYFRATDSLSGLHNDFPFVASYVDSGNYVKDSEGHSREQSVFRGLVLLADFPKASDGWLTVHSDRLGKLSWLVGEVRTIRDAHYVRMDNPEFEEHFHIRASSAQFANYILSADFMNRILDLRARYPEQPMVFAFREGTALVGVARPENPFLVWDEAGVTLALDATQVTMDILEETFRHQLAKVAA